MRKNNFSLILVMILSLSIFVTNMAGLRMAVKAAEQEDFMFSEDNSGGYDSYDDNPVQGSSFDGGDDYYEEQPQAESSGGEQDNFDYDQYQKMLEEEAARQEAYERLAVEAEEEAMRQIAEDAAAAEAKRLAEEEAEKARLEAEKAAAALEEAKKKAAESEYSLKAISDGGSLSSLYLSASVGAGDFDAFSVVNNGKNDVELVYGISGASSDAFTLSMYGGNTILSPSQAADFYIELKQSTPVGNHSATLFFKDRDDSKNEHTIYISVKATVTEASRIKRVTIYPKKVTVGVGGDCDFYADVDAEGEIDRDVNWSLTGARSSDTFITSDGTLFVGEYESASSISVIATSVANSRYSDQASVAVKSGSYNVKAVADPSKGGIVTGGGAVSRGSYVTLSAVPNKNYYFEGWIRDGKKVSTSTNYTVENVESNMTITAKFKQNFVNITAVSENENAGTVVGGGKISYGGKTTLSAKARDGYVFTGWMEGNNILSTSASIELKNLTVDRKIVAKFSKTSYTITVSASPSNGGTVSGGGVIALGSSTTIQATPAQGYTFQSWNLNGQIVSRDATCKIDRVDRDYSFTAVFIQTGIVTHTISAGVATTGGTINPSGITVVARGQSLTYTITPKTGFAILAVAVDGVQVGPVSTYTFPSITGDHAIAAAFVQTDAGAKAAEASGQKPQAEKVQEVAKTPANTATENKTVDIEEAASGTAGDEFVEEMDLSEINIPTDAELGIEEFEELQADSPVLKALGASMDDVRRMIEQGNRFDVITAAFYEGNLDFFVDNRYEARTEVPDYHELSREDLEQTPADDIYPSMLNLDQVTEKLLTNNDLISLAEGGETNISVVITKTDDSVDEANKKVLNSAVGQKPLQYFDITMIKSVDGTPENIETVEVPMEMVFKIPDEIYRKGKTYSVLRAHDGVVDVLPDLDNDPETITFRTDRFSAYAISEQLASAKQLAIRFAIGGLIALLIALICLVILLYHQIRAQRERKKVRRVKKEQ